MLCVKAEKEIGVHLSVVLTLRHTDAIWGMV